MKKTCVLDEGYVRFVDKMGSDLTIVNSARVSYNKEVGVMEERDARLIEFLVREKHTSPFRHATLQFEVYAPLMVARQWFKYVVGSDHTMDAWNESSRRYVSDDVEFYVPDAKAWRSAPDNSKQGSGEPILEAIGNSFTEMLSMYQKSGRKNYQFALDQGIAPEQARLFLPANGQYVRWYWTGSLQSVLHFLNERLENDAQWEIQQYAKAILPYVEEAFPIACRTAMGGDET